jgi:lipoyl(octanoyl) transferase
MKKICNVEKLGLIPYQQAWDRQNTLAEKIALGDHPQSLLLLQHPHTYTLGRRGQLDHLLWSEQQLASNGVSVLWVDRGGDITYHGPGQLVGYPLLRLAPIGWQGDRLPGADYVGYLRNLETVIINTLANFGVSGFRVDGKTGVWVSPKDGDDIKKIASIGVKVDSKGVSRHGFALNISPDMSFWEGIVPCGLAGVEMVSMADLLSYQVAIDHVQNVLVDHFGQTFDLKMVFDEERKDH